MIDLHNHTIFSDGSCHPQKIIETAENIGLNFIAITDHYTTSWKASIINHLTKKTIPEYLNTIRKIREKSQVGVLIGVEIDTESNLQSLIDIPLDKFELILFEYVKSLNTLKTFYNFIKKTLDTKKVNEYPIIALAHPNIHLSLNKNILEEEFIPYIVKNEIYFELNTRYSEYYIGYEPIIKKLIDNGVKFTIGSDSHSISRIGESRLAFSFLSKLNGIKNLINNEKLSKYILKI